MSCEYIHVGEGLSKRKRGGRGGVGILVVFGNAREKKNARACPYPDPAILKMKSFLVRKVCDENVINSTSRKVCCRYIIAYQYNSQCFFIPFAKSF